MFFLNIFVFQKMHIKCLHLNLEDPTLASSPVDHVFLSFTWGCDTSSVRIPMHPVSVTKSLWNRVPGKGAMFVINDHAVCDPLRES